MNAVLVSLVLATAGTTVTPENPAYYLVALTEMMNDGKSYLHPKVETLNLLNNAPDNKKACENRKALLVTQIELTNDRQAFYRQIRQQGFYGDLQTILICWTETEWVDSFRHARMCDYYGRDCDKMPF